MKNIREFIGQSIFVAGLLTVVVSVLLSGDFTDGAEGAIVGGAVAILIGYCIAGWDPKDGPSVGY